MLAVEAFMEAVAPSIAFRETGSARADIERPLQDSGAKKRADQEDVDSGCSESSFLPKNRSKLQVNRHVFNESRLGL